MKKFHHLLFVFFILTLLTASISIAVSANVSTAGGTCGDNLTWVLDPQGTLTISGTGPMDDYPYPFFSSGIIYPQYPWKDVAASIKRVVIQEGVTNIGEAAFIICPNLTNVTISDTVTSIGRDAFYGCNNLTSVTIGKNVTRIDSHAFFSCEKLKDVILPDSLTEFGRAVFGDCSSLTAIAIPDGVTEISPGLFFRCTGLTCVYIPEGVTVIRTQAFDECDVLQAILLPKSIELIEGMAFFSCDCLQRIYYKGSQADWNRIEIKDRYGNVTNANKLLLDTMKIYNFAGDTIIGTVVFQDWDGTVISTRKYSLTEGVIVPDAPERPADSENTYVFSGWDKTLVPYFNGDITYTATYRASPLSSENTTTTEPTATEPTVTEPTPQQENGIDQKDIAVIVSVAAVSTAVIIAVLLRKKKQ